MRFLQAQTRSLRWRRTRQRLSPSRLSAEASKRDPRAHAISGSWRAFKVTRSRNGSIIKYKCTSDGFNAETPLGERFDAKFDGKFYRVEDGPGHTMVSLKLIDANTVELIGKRDGKIISVMRLAVAPDAKIDSCSSGKQRRQQ